MSFSRPSNPLSPDTKEVDEYVKRRTNVQNMTSEQMKHKLYV